VPTAIETRNWRCETDADDIVWLTLDRPGSSANALSREIMTELDTLLQPLANTPPRGLVVISGKDSGFVAGADIKEFTSLTTPAVAYELISAGQRVLQHLEDLPCPTVAAIHGFALGGGLELALACRYRVAVGDDRLTLGFPEVQLGIHPGFGGTVRSVRLIGARAAMDLMLTGRNLRADKALSLGLVDRLVASRDELRPAAVAIIKSAPAPRRPPMTERLLSLAPARPFIASAMLKQVRKRARREHYPAPYAMVDLWRRHGANGAIAFESEARSIADLFVTPTSRNLVRVFLLQDKLKGRAARTTANIRKVHVVGAGVMGGDIAAWCALRGMDVTLQDRALEFIEPAMIRAREQFDKRYKGGPKAAEALARLRADVAGDGVPEADVVIEAIFENLQAKQELYARLEPRMKPAALLASNTSSIMIEELASRLAKPARLAGLHFFNPVAQMPLIEIVRGKNTDPAMLEAALAFVRKADKIPLPCASAPGFVVNRVLVPYLFEAMHAAAENVPLAVIDQCMIDFGMPMGPVELADVVGLDVCKHVGDIVSQALGRPAPDLTKLRELVAAKKLGRKSGEGFYRWVDGKALKPPVAGAVSPADLADRLVLALVNECVACLREKIVDDEDSVDAGVVFGAGFAPFRGGPLHYARQRGLANCRNRLEALQARYGSRFAPDAGWSLLNESIKA
jgi:3-hydroxyacyl-CoA dehydrogenase/enoyl-CoA hydratase/3-hydroxybutyryl-CoA epimerase